VSWIGPLIVTLFGGFLRFHNLALPKGKVFDEVYYVTGAQQLIANGVEFDLVKKQADFVVHPPLGKWIIAAGIKLFGDNEFGWRVAIAFLGTLSILILARTAQRLFGSALLGSVAGLLLAIDGLHFAHSRTALLDLSLMFFILCAFAFLIRDREDRRARLMRGTSIGWSPYRIAAGVSMGLALAVKWSALYYLVAFVALMLAWDFGAARRSGDARPLRALLRISIPRGVLQMGLLPIATYLIAWTGWFRSDIGYGRHWADGRESSFSFIPAALRSLWHYHVEMYRFHVNLTSDHPYMANPWSWLVMTRPTAFYYKSLEAGQEGCLVAKCSQAIVGLGNPLIWWAGTIALFLALWAWIARRDWRAGAIVVGVAAGYAPWFLFQERTIYNFYAVVFAPFVVLAVTYMVGMILGSSPDEVTRRNRAIAAGFVVLVAVGVFFYMLPVLDATVIPEDAWRSRMWLSTWI
jgi:dolichyl-phosphate-mannose--protein O-mannosyl transferase